MRGQGCAGGGERRGGTLVGAIAESLDHAWYTERVRM
jgi:hypothetical protein